MGTEEEVVWVFQLSFAIKWYEIMNLKGRLRALAARIVNNSHGMLPQIGSSLRSRVLGNANMVTPASDNNVKISPFQVALENYTKEVSRRHKGKIEPTDLRRTLAYLPPLNGYSAPFSVKQGERVDLHLARNVVAPSATRHHAFQSFREFEKVPVKRRILLDPVSNKILSQVDFPNGVTCRNELPKSYKGDGADYTTKFGLNTAALSPGIYEARFIDASGMASEGIYFNVRPVEPSNDMFAVILPTMTWQAYNRVGGGSFYSTALGYRREVSMSRPLPHKYADGPDYCIPFLRVLRDNSIPYFCVTSEDLHDGTVDLRHFNAAAILTHDEYYTDEMYEQMRGYLADGGRLVVAGGNTMYRRAHASDNRSETRSFHVNFGEYFAAPERTKGTDGSMAEEKLLGASYALGGWPLGRAVSNRAILTEKEALEITPKDLRKSRGYKVEDPEHWLFRGIDVAKGDLIGADSCVMDVEVDGVRIDAKSAIDREKSEFVPENTSVIATTEIGSKHFGRERVGCLVETKHGSGEVLNFCTVGLVNGLITNDTEVVRMVSNAFNWAAGRPLGSSSKEAIKFGVASQVDKETYEDSSFREDTSVISTYYERIFSDFFSDIEFAGKAIVDIGPGLEHFFVDILRRHDANVWTIDFSMDVIAKSRERNLHAVAADLRVFPLGLMKGRFDGVFCRGSFNPFWFSSPEIVYARACDLANLIKPGGWSWIAPYNAISEFSGRDSSRNTEIIDAQRSAFEDCGFSCFELSVNQQKKYRITRALSHPLFVKNLPEDAIVKEAVRVSDQ